MSDETDRMQDASELPAPRAREVDGEVDTLLAAETPAPVLEDLRSEARARAESEEPTGRELQGDSGRQEEQRMRRRRALLQQEIELETLEQQLRVLRRRRLESETPGAVDRGAATPVSGQSVHYTDFGDREGFDAESRIGSARGAPVQSKGLATRPRMKEPDPFRGKTIKEARDFLLQLELVFALAADSYRSDHDRVLYGVMFLVGEPRETWHHTHSVTELGDYSWKDFRRFVMDAVEDPVNRSLTVGVQYEQAKQTDSQSVQAFAAELATIEEQMEPYTPAQRVRHLLVKLRPSLRTAVVTYHDIPKTREELVSLATRLESAVRGHHNALPNKRAAEEQLGRRSGPKKSREDTRPEPKSGEKAERSRGARDKPAPPGSCWTCGEAGHYASQCRRAAARKVKNDQSKSSNAMEGKETKQG